MKKFLAVFLVCMVLIGMVPKVLAAEVLETGKCGPDATYTIYDDGTMVISGTGKVNDVYEELGIGTGVTFYKSITEPLWDYYTLRYDKLLINKVVIEEGITELGSGALYGIYYAKELVLPDSLTIIGDGAFYGLDRLTTIELPKTVSFLGNYVFAKCRKLKSVTIPDNFEKIRAKTLKGSYLRDVYFEGTEERWNQVFDAEGSQIPYFNGNDFLYTVHFLGKTTDIPSPWAEPEINEARGLKLIPEEMEQNYKGAVSRKAIAGAIVNCLEKTTGKTVDAIMAERGVSSDTGAFSDTADAAVLAANALGIIKGVGNGKFDPDGKLTRAQAAAIANRIAEILGVDTSGYTHSFTDVKGHWASPELGWASSAGVLKGVGNDRFDPDSNLTTEQTILVFLRLYKALK